MYSKYCSDFSQTRETSNADVTHLAFTASRLVSSAGHTTGRSRITRKPIVSRYFETHGGVIYTRYKMLDGELINIGRAYEHADSTFHLCLIAHGEPPANCLRLVEKRSEVAHAQYASQLRQDRVNPLTTAQTMLSTFLLDQMLTSECGLGIFMAIWARLRTDCTEIYHWVKNPQTVRTPCCFCYAYILTDTRPSPSPFCATARVKTHCMVLWRLASTSLRQQSIPLYNHPSAGDPTKAFI